MAKLNCLPGKDIDLKALVAKVRDIAAADPGFMYGPLEGTGYRYFDDGQPSCLIGHALHALGFNAEDVLEECVYVDDDAPLEVFWLSGVQAEQDSGTSWGEAVKKADRIFPL